MKILCVIFLLLFITQLHGQECFDRYDLLFENGGDTLSYEAFQKRELKFLEDLNGCKAIHFEGATYDNSYISLEDFKGKVVVLNFWFTTCPPCLKEIPELNRLMTLYDPDDVVFIGLARDNREKLDAFFERFEPFLFTIIPESYDIAAKYKVVAWPQTMIINTEGAIYKSWAGLHQSAKEQRLEIETAINDCL